ncbi:hypothetical protein [Niastella populi]|uniref:Uncharacterized protein n=1 Tax=Niastella populi TaxID=550983 RepID=A0A1V9FE86_9BACT|nr:hypothetical protein [Niastella populi]OQP56601.1 hypothetical protein A4R26_05430 [Niastella populi]
MNYAKVLDAALTMFPRKVKVTCIDGVSGQPIGRYKVLLHHLPNVFNKPITLTIEGNEWRVIKASPVHSDEFSIFRKLTLHVLNKEQEQQSTLGHNVPTRHASIPATTPTAYYEQFTVHLQPTDWLQMEFLPAAELPLIQEEVALIAPVLLPENGLNPLLGYETPHVRHQTAHLGVDIPFDAFCAAIQVNKKGNIRIEGHEYVQNGFALQSDNYEYYGTVVNNRITHLSLTGFDSVDDEFFRLVTTWELVLVKWVECSITTVQPDITEET